MSVLRLALPAPLRRLFDYLPPAELSPESVATLRPGVRLRVPFGKREITGVLVEVCEASDLPIEQLKAATALLDPQPLPNPELLELCHWAAQYYHHPIGEVLMAAFPTRLRGDKPPPLAGERGWRLTTKGKGLPGGALKRSPKQALALQLLAAGDGVRTTELKSQDISASVMRSLADKDLVEACDISPAAQSPVANQGLELSDEQANAVSKINETLGSFSCHLLQGVTGSGKTEVYLRVIEDCLKQGKQALVLIPEIGLTPQTVARFEHRFDASIDIFHSGLTENQRYRAWENARSGRTDIVIGTRSAIFTAMPRLGLIVVDEEHDQSYKQQDGFRYAGRDVAVKRAQLECCPVVLGSATPALETMHNASQGRYQRHLLLERAGSGTMPSLEVADIRGQTLRGGLSDALMVAVHQTLSNGQQALLFLNRRGFAPTLQCHDCGWQAQCRSCDARMTVHRRPHRLRCHHCGAAAHIPASCPECHSRNLLTHGLGTEQAADILQQEFPQWPVHRVDSDTTSSREAMSQLLNEINSGAPCILLGTQMLAKGHHFPGVTLAAVIDADAMLFSTDFRGEEKMAQLLTQVGGRAGRDKTPGRVIMQSHHPDHPTLQAILEKSYMEQATGILDRRQEVGLPPYGHLAVLRTDCSDADFGERFLASLRRQLEQQGPGACSLVGPLPSPMHRRAGKYRSQLIISASSRGALQQGAHLAVGIAQTLPGRRDFKWSIDIDPQDPI